MNRLPGLAAEADEDVRGDIGMLRKAGKRAVELVVVRAAVLHRAAGLVRDRDDAVHVRILLEQVGGAKALGDVLARRRGAVDGADDGNVVAAAVAKMLGAIRPAVVAHPEARLGGLRRRRTIAAKRVVALEGIGGNVVYVDMIARRDVLIGEADDLTVLVDRGALLDRHERDLMTEAD